MTKSLINQQNSEDKRRLQERSNLAQIKAMTTKSFTHQQHLPDSLFQKDLLMSTKQLNFDLTVTKKQFTHVKQQRKI